MENRLDCRDIGIDCDYGVCTPVPGEALRKVGEHIQTFHGMKQFSKGFYKKASAALREGSCAQPKECSGGVCRL